MARVYSSTVVAAPASTVWGVVRDFNGLPNWTKFVAESQIEQNMEADRVGCVRNFRLNDGGRIRERLLALSDYDMYCTYSILESPMGVETFIEWTADFEAAPDREDRLIEDIGRNVFAAGLAALKSRFAR
jgi:hypothetical protein